MNGDEQAIRKFVYAAFCKAVHLDTSDIYFEIFETNFIIQYRVNGTLRDHAVANKDIDGPAVRHLKVLNNLNIAEQDRNVVQCIYRGSVKFCISTLPT
jgi:general secretion pathway protein E